MFVTQIRLESSLAQSFETQKAKKTIHSLAQSTKHFSRVLSEILMEKISVYPNFKTFLDA